MYLFETHIPNMERIIIKNEEGKTIGYEYKVIDPSKLPATTCYSPEYIAWEEEYIRKRRETPVDGSMLEPPVAPLTVIRREKAEARTRSKAQS